MTLKSALSALIIIIIAIWTLLGCQSDDAPTDTAASAAYVFVTVTPSEPVISDAGLEMIATALNPQEECTGGFASHRLDHITTNAYKPINMYDSNGAGVAIDDLDNDGDMDIVLANLASDNTIFWNQGDFQFEKATFPHGSSRAAVIVDVDGDNWRDIVFTTRVGSLIYWRNQGNNPQDVAFPFEQTPLTGVQEHAYAMTWSDLDSDGDLDIVTGSYDTALEKELRDSFMFGDGAGVFVFENQGDGFISERLADTSQALAIELLDLNEDGRDDILVGNDFDSVRDQYWLASTNGWQPTEPFEITTQNTMSFDVGDVNNDGSFELIATDMHPYAFDEETNAAWDPVMEMMHMEPMEGDPQRMENVLQSRDANGNFSNMAHDTGVAYSGWSWSSRFGDLDQDGFLDLYIVNGMATSETFAHMPNYELVEENQAYRNDGTGNFVSMPDWSLNDTAGGRGMTMADLDGDGDLDIVVNNLLSEAMVFENQICEGDALLVNLNWQEDGVQNTQAIGSQIILETDKGRLVRKVRTTAGYLSGVPSTVHFGLPTDSTSQFMEIHWPDGQVSKIENLAAGSRLTINRN